MKRGLGTECNPVKCVERNVNTNDANHFERKRSSNIFKYYPNNHTDWVRLNTDSRDKAL